MDEGSERDKTWGKGGLLRGMDRIEGKRSLTDG